MATSSSDTAFLTMIKSMDYRGSREIWSNGYHLDVAPSSDADWAALANYVWNMEAAFLDSSIQYEGATGHMPGTPPVLVWEVDAGTVGEGGPTGQFVPGGAETPTPGDVAGWVRWKTDRKTNRGKPIYFRNYYHGMYIWGDKDQVASNQHANMLTLANAWQVGVPANGKTFRRSGPKGGSAQDHSASIYLTTRTLERRGKRKKTVGGSSSGSSLLDAIEKSLAARGLISILEGAAVAGA